MSIPYRSEEELVERLTLEITGRQAGDEGFADVQRLDRHRLAVGEPQAADDHHRLRRRDVQEASEVRAGGHHAQVERPEAGVIPRRRMSSVNDVIVSS